MALLAPFIAVGQRSSVGGKAVQFSDAGTSVTIGCPNTEFPAQDLSAARSENDNLYQLLRDMTTAYRKVLPDTLSKLVFDSEERLWMASLNAHCKKEARNVKRIDRALLMEACERWAGMCRLEDLLTRYDAIKVQEE